MVFPAVLVLGLAATVSSCGIRKCKETSLRDCRRNCFDSAGTISEWRARPIVMPDGISLKRRPGPPQQIHSPVAPALALPSRFDGKVATKQGTAGDLKSTQSGSLPLLFNRWHYEYWFASKIILFIRGGSNRHAEYWH